MAARALKEEENVNELLQRFTMINDTVSECRREGGKAFGIH